MSGTDGGSGEHPLSTLARPSTQEAESSVKPVWLVTGAAGFLGSNAGLWLGKQVRRVGQTRTSHPIPNFDDQHVLDLRESRECRDLVTRVKPNVVLHAAAISGHQTCADDPDQAVAVNVRATQELSEAAKNVGAKFIYISTDSVFSGATGNYSELDTPDPFSLYGETKLRGELVAQETSDSSLIVRTNFFGWSRPANRSVLEFFVNSLRRAQVVEGYPDVVTTSLYVRTLLRYIWCLTEREESGVVHVASSDALSKFDYGQEIARQFELNGSLIAAATDSSKTLMNSRGRNLSLNTDHLAQLLGHSAETQLEGIISARKEESLVKTGLSEGAD